MALRSAPGSRRVWSENTREISLFPDDSFETELQLTLDAVFSAFGESFFLIFFRGDMSSLPSFTTRFPFDLSTLFEMPFPFIDSSPFMECFEYFSGLSKLVCPSLSRCFFLFFIVEIICVGSNFPTFRRRIGADRFGQGTQTFVISRNQQFEATSACRPQMPIRSGDEWLALCKEENKLQVPLRRHIYRIDNYVVKIDLAADEPDEYGDFNDPVITRLLSENAKAMTELVSNATTIPMPRFIEDGYLSGFNGARCYFSV